MHAHFDDISHVNCWVFYQGTWMLYIPLIVCHCRRNCIYISCSLYWRSACCWAFHGRVQIVLKLFTIIDSKFITIKINTFDINCSISMITPPLWLSFDQNVMMTSLDDYVLLVLKNSVNSVLGFVQMCQHNVILINLCNDMLYGTTWY